MASCRPLYIASLILLCLAAFALRAYRLGDLSLWYDEGWSVHLARLAPWQALPQIMGSGHTHPPLYYLLLGMAQALAGPSEFSMRFLSLMAGVLTVALGYRLGRDLFGGGTGWATGCLLALVPSQITYAQEARSYALFALEYALLLWLIGRFLQRRQQWSGWGWAALILAEAAACYTHYFALILLAYLGLAVSIALLWSRSWAVWRRWLGAQALVALLYLPWAWTTVRQLQEHAPPDMRPLPLHSFLGLVWRFWFSGLSWAAARYPHLVQATLALALLGGLSLLGNLLLRRMGGYDALALGAFLLPLAGVFAIEQVQPGIHPRYTLMLSVPLLLSIARQTALWLKGPAWPRVVGAALAIALTASLATGLQAAFQDYHKDDVRGLAAYLKATATPQDLILFDYEDFAFQYYDRGPASVLYLEGYGPPESLARRVLEAAQKRQRAFLVTWYTGHTDRRELYPFLLELNGYLEEDRSFRGLRLRQYRLQSVLEGPALAPVSANYGLIHLDAAFWERAVTADGAIAVALRWRMVQAVGARYKAAVILKDYAGRSITSVDSPLVNDRGRPTEEWLPGTEAEGYYVVPIPAGTPPLTYSLAVALYTESAPEGLDLLSPTGAPSGKHFDLGEVVLTPSSLPQRDPYGTEALSLLAPVEALLARGLVLEAARVERASVQPGTRVPALLRWQATEGQLPSYEPTLRLVRRGQVLAEQRSAPADGRYPTDRWREGEMVLERRELLVGPQVPAGEAAVEIQVGMGQPVTLTAISIETTEHLFQLPPVPYPAYARFGEVAELVGYDLPVTKVIPRQEVALILYWRGLNREPLATDYIIFTHLLTEGEGRLVAQHDGPPAGGQRPTTSWLEGEIIVDPHLLSWREEYMGLCPIEVGVYNPTTGERLPAYRRDGSRLPHDRVLLGQALEVRAEGTSP